MKIIKKGLDELQKQILLGIESRGFWIAFWGSLILFQQEDKPSTVLNILAFLFPVIGLILFLCFQKTTPVRAKAIGKWALIGFIVGVALSILSGVLGALAS